MDESLVYQELHTLVPGPDTRVEKFNESFAGCTCQGPCDSRCKCVRFTNLEGENYDDRGRLVSEAGSMIECSYNCRCFYAGTCKNRVVQQGIKVQMQVVWLGIKGYGVVAAEDIDPNTFICQYAGEVIGGDEVERRVKQTVRAPHNYIFTVKEHMREGALVHYIDARYHGNIARFMNHSCDPNLQVAIVRLGSEIPHVAFFARRRIWQGEELCYDYEPPARPAELGEMEIPEWFYTDQLPDMEEDLLARRPLTPDLEAPGSVGLPDLLSPTGSPGPEIDIEELLNRPITPSPFPERKPCWCGANNCRSYLPVSETGTS